MRAFESCNPIVITAYYLSVICILMFSQNPFLLLLGFFGAINYFIFRNGQKNARSHLFCFFVFLIMSLINPLLSHNGKTVLFVINDSPVTLEATVYGIVSAGIIVTVLYLFRSFTEIMTRDKLLYVFGKLSTKLSLILSIGLRYVPLFKERAKKIYENQKALGLYKEDNVLDKIKCDLRIFSILITWALENGITTADSMSARGYGKKKRTYYSLFKFGKADVFILILIILCFTITIIGIGVGTLDFIFYPSIRLADATPLGIVTYIAYGVLTLMPIIMETEERLKWRYLQSKI